MSLFTAEERRFATDVSKLIYCNPFLPERIEFEKAALGSEFDEHGAQWNLRLGSGRKPPNVVKLVRRVRELLDHLRSRLDSGAVEIMAGADAALYEDLLMFVLFDGLGLGEVQAGQPAGTSAALYKQLESSARPFLCVGRRRLPLFEQLPHVFACFYQLHRAFQNIFHYIIGFSRAADS